MTPETYRDYSEHQAGFPEKLKTLVETVSNLQQQFNEYEGNNPINLALNERNRNPTKALELIMGYSAELVRIFTSASLLNLEISILLNTIDKLLQEIEPEASPENPFVLDALVILTYQKAVLQSHTLNLNNLLQLLEKAQIDLIGLEYLIKSESPTMLKTRAYIGSKLDKYGIEPRELESISGQELLARVFTNLPVGIDISPNWKKYPGIDQINSLILQYVIEHHPHKIPVPPVAMQWDKTVVHQPETKPKALAVSAFATSLAARRSSSSVFFVADENSGPKANNNMLVDSVGTLKRSSKGKTKAQTADIASMDSHPSSRKTKPLREINGQTSKATQQSTRMDYSRTVTPGW